MNASADADHVVTNTFSLLYIFALLAHIKVSIKIVAQKPISTQQEDNNVNEDNHSILYSHTNSAVLYRRRITNTLTLQAQRDQQMAQQFHNNITHMHSPF